MTLYALPSLLSLGCFLALAVLTLMRGTRTRQNRIFIALCLLASFLYASFSFSALTRSAIHALWASRIEHLFIPLLLPLYITFFQDYLGMPRSKGGVRSVYALAFIIMALAPTDLLISHMTPRKFGFVAGAGPLYFLFVLGEVLTTFYVIVLLYRALRGEAQSVRRNRLKYVLVGFGSLGFLNGLNFLSIYGLPLYPPGEFSFIPLLVFAVGLFKHDLLDMGFLIKKSLVYSALTALLTCLYALLIILANRLFSKLLLADSLFLTLLFFLLITFIFGPLKNGVQHLVDRLFSREKYEYRQALTELSRRIVSELSVDRIGEQLLSTVEHVMRLYGCDLFLKDESPSIIPLFRKHPGDRPITNRETFPEVHPLVQAIQAQRKPFLSDPALGDLSGPETPPVWVFPLLFKDRLNGFLLLGEKRSGDLFTREDLDLLETLCDQSALAIENALSYHRIAQLNDELERKVIERTQALQNALAEKERTQEQLIRSESLAAIGQLVAGVAHELNNPLTSAISLLQSTLEEMKETPGAGAATDMIEDLAFAEKELARAKGIVQSLLGLSRQTDTYREEVDLTSVVKDAARILYNRYKHEPIHVETRYDEDLPPILGNFGALGQVALNILQNAIQAVSGQQEGRITLVTRHDAETGEVVFECLDSGPGIPEAVQKDIFKPFFTTKEVGQGTGLGLYISHEIIRKHGGTLTFTSDDTGARFMVRLPVLKEPR